MCYNLQHSIIVTSWTGLGSKGQVTIGDRTGNRIV